MDATFIGEVRQFAGNFAPRNWSFCEGQLLPISQNTALFSILGTIYGGDGRSTFALPDLQGRTPYGSSNMGPSAGTPTIRLGQKGGVESVTLNQTQLPYHNHSSVAQVKFSSLPATSTSPDNRNWAGEGIKNYTTSDIVDVDMSADSVEATLANTGGNSPHNNMNPFIVLNYIIALQGPYPSRS